MHIHLVLIDIIDHFRGPLLYVVFKQWIKLFLYTGLLIISRALTIEVGSHSESSFGDDKDEAVNSVFCKCVLFDFTHLIGFDIR